MKASELLREVEAEEKLREMGWTKRRCPICQGTGDSTKLGYGITLVDPAKPCDTCQGYGAVWRKGSRAFPAS